MIPLFVDENIPKRMVEALRMAGFDLSWGQDFQVGAPDEQRMQEAFLSKQAILTEDADFIELAIVRRLPVWALLIVQLQGMRAPARIERVLAALKEIGNIPIGEIVIIEPNRIRRRSIEDARAERDRRSGG